MRGLKIFLSVAVPVILMIVLLQNRITPAPGELVAVSGQQATPTDPPTETPLEIGQRINDPLETAAEAIEKSYQAFGLDLNPRNPVARLMREREAMIWATISSAQMTAEYLSNPANNNLARAGSYDNPTWIVGFEADPFHQADMLARMLPSMDPEFIPGVSNTASGGTGTSTAGGWGANQNPPYTQALYLWDANSGDIVYLDAMASVLGPQNLQVLAALQSESLPIQLATANVIYLESVGEGTPTVSPPFDPTSTSSTP